MILLKNRDRNPSFKKGEYVEINDAGNYPMELSVDGVCKQETTSISAGDEYDSPSPDYPQPISTIENSLKITSCNKNLIDLSEFFDTTLNGITITNNRDGSLTLNGTATGNIVTSIIKYKYAKESEFGIYTFKCFGLPSNCYNDVWYGIPRPYGEEISRVEYKNKTDNYAINLYIPNGTSLTNVIIRPILVKGSYTSNNFPSFEQHLQSQITANLPEGEFVGKLDDTYKDTLNVVYKDDGHYHLVLNKMIGKVVLDGSEDIKDNWQNYNTPDYIQFYLPSSFLNNNYIDNKAKNCKCNNFISPGASVWDYNNEGFAISRDIKYTLQFKLSKQRIKTIDDFKSWLSINNTEVYYTLATPYVVDLGIVDTLLSYDEVTNVFTDSDLYPVINVKYYKDFEFDKILRSGYNIDEQEYEIAKKQMANGKRKRILSSYDDCIIKINLGLLDNKTYQEYKEQLDDGEFHYWSYKYNQYKKANFILTKPSIITEYAYDDDIGINDMEIILEKSSDIE